MTTIICKAAVAFAPNEPMRVVDIQVEAPKAGEVRVRVIANALCHTDIYTLTGCDPEGAFPTVLGHEATAVIESVGEGVTNYQVGDLVVPCYTPQCQEWDCIFCNSDKTNLCPKIRATQGKGMMPDGTSRLKTMDGQMIYHFMGCSTFAEYAVLASISLAKINPASNPYQTCVLGCGIPTGWGAVMNNPNFHANSSVAVWGLGAVGLAVIQAAKLAGATRIYGIDINEKKFGIAKEFGCTDCFNPKDGSTRAFLTNQEKWGVDFTYDCTGSVMVMREALEMAHRGFGESMVIGVAAAGQELQTRPFQLVTGRCWKGTAFGGWKSVQDVPKLSDKVLTGELPIDKYITHEFEGIDKIQELVDTLKAGDCLRGVLKIGSYDVKEKPKIQVISNQKTFGGRIKAVKHWSHCNQCWMTFNIFVPEDEVNKQRTEPYPVLYHCGGLSSTQDNGAWKSGFAQHAAKHKICIVFPDTSPRDVAGGYEPVGAPADQWKTGYGAGFYCNATQAPWSKHWNMYTYITKELPQLVEQYFHVSSVKSITGHSMGGNGALMIAARNPDLYKSVSAFAPICSQSLPTSSFCVNAMKAYFANEQEAQLYDCTHAVKNAAKLPVGLIDFGTHDEYRTDLKFELLVEALGSGNHKNVKHRWQDGYDHGFYFVSTFYEEHVAFHAHHLHK